jgi:putative membrane protein
LSTLALACTTLIGSPNLMAQASSADTDKQFLTTASQSDYTEIKFSQLAAEKATNPRVKAYANKMITDHNKLEAEMKPYADKWGVTPVMTLDADHQAKYDALSSMSGMDFVKTYMTDMDADHHKALSAFKSEETATTDQDFKKTVAKGEKVVAQHTMMADKAVTMMGGTPGSM